jgi:hypothetical protein
VEGGFQYRRVQIDRRTTTDQRRSVSKGKYLNCLLALEDASVHNNSIRSDQPQSYYALVLSGTTVKAGLGDKEYRRIASGGPLGIEGPPGALALKNGSSSDEFDAPGSRAPKRPRAVAKAKMAPLLALPDAEYASPPPSPSSPRTASSTSVSVGGGVSDVESHDGVGRSSISGWVEMERGPRFKADAYKPQGKNKHLRLVVECTYHDGCYKKRSLSANATKDLGPLEVVGYLLAWNSLGCDLDRAEHIDRKLEVPTSEIVRYCATVGDRAEPILAIMKRHASKNNVQLHVVDRCIKTVHKHTNT